MSDYKLPELIVVEKLKILVKNHDEVEIEILCKIGVTDDYLDFFRLLWFAGLAPLKVGVV